nr:hypothetical protein [Tanacetum cinerariifolium]
RKLKATLPKKIDLTEHVSAFLSSSLSPKFKDPGAPLISVVVGNIAIKKVLLDLGASINILPVSLVDKYDLGTLLDFFVMDTESPYKDVQPTIILGRPFLVMIDARINCQTSAMDIAFGILEDVIVKDDDFYYPVDFFVMDTESPYKDVQPTIILGRPFLVMIDAMINCQTSAMDIAFAQEIQEYLVSSLDYKRPHWSYKVEPLPANFDTVTKPSLEVPLTLELNHLPSNLKYAFLGHKNTLPIIVASDLSGSQEEALLKVLSKYKAAVGWTIADLKGISPSLCMHPIFTDPDVKPSKDAQRRLNPKFTA